MRRLPAELNINHMDICCREFRSWMHHLHAARAARTGGTLQAWAIGKHPIPLPFSDIPPIEALWLYAPGITRLGFTHPLAFVCYSSAPALQNNFDPQWHAALGWGCILNTFWRYVYPASGRYAVPAGGVGNANLRRTMLVLSAAM